MAFIYHLVARSDWEASHGQDQYSADSLTSEGFNHCSRDYEQLFAVARRLFADRTDMLALELDTDRLVSSIKEEPSGSGEIYPHIYGPINKSAVARVLVLAVGEGGDFSLVEA